MWTMLAFDKSPGTKPGDLAGHRLTTPKGPVQCESILVIDTPPGIYNRQPSWGLEHLEQAPMTVTQVL